MAQSDVSLGAYELPTTYLPRDDVPTAELASLAPSARAVQRTTTMEGQSPSLQS